MLRSINPRKTAAWQQLATHHRAIRRTTMRELFRQDPGRFERMSLRFEELLVDYSKNRVNAESLRLLVALAEEAALPAAIEQMFRGDRINATEGRAVLHTALRNRANTPVLVEGHDVMPEVNAVLAQMQRFSERVIGGEWRGYTGKPVDRYRQYRHRRLRPRPGHGDRGAQGLPAAAPAHALRLQRRRNPPCRNVAGPRPGADPLPGGLQNLHHPGDHGQRHHGAALAAGPRR